MVSISLIPRKHQIGCGEKRFFVFFRHPCPGWSKAARETGKRPFSQETPVRAPGRYCCGSAAAPPARRASPPLAAKGSAPRIPHNSIKPGKRSQLLLTARNPRPEEQHIPHCRILPAPPVFLHPADDLLPFRIGTFFQIPSVIFMYVLQCRRENHR